jgi:hypothetical protein
VTGDVYRRDAIDVTHFPVFHQMEGVRIFTVEELVARSRLLREKWTFLSEEERHAEGVRVVEEDLKQALIGMVHALFPPNTNTRWVDAYFPFTTPSFELEIFFNSKWLEVLGSGIIHPLILRNCGYTNGEIGWAFGLGLERLALVLFDIPDIRLFWSKGAILFSPLFFFCCLMLRAAHSSKRSLFFSLSMSSHVSQIGDFSISFLKTKSQNLNRSVNFHLVIKIFLFGFLTRFISMNSSNSSERWLVLPTHLI